MAREVTEREAAAETVAAAADAHAAKVSEGFVEKFKAFAPKKQPLPEMGNVLRTLATALRASAAELVEASARHDAELADDAAPRDARDNATRELIEAMVAIRAATESVYGRAGLKALGIEGRTPTDTKGVLEHARKLVAQLEDAKLKLPKPQDGLAVDRSVWVAKLQKPLAVLAQARKDVAREEREAQITSNTKSKAMASFDELFGVVATFTSSMLDLIGEDELAARIKPSPRRRGVTAETDTGDTTSLAGEGSAPAPGNAPASPG